MKPLLIGITAFVVFAITIRLASTPVKACGTGWFEEPCNSTAGEMEKLRGSQERMVSNVPVPEVKTSQERLNIKRRAELFDNENKISYIYLVSYGRVMSFFTVKGKVSSLRSYMVPQEQLVYGDGSKCNGMSSSCYTIQSPDIDGSYGDNVDGIFFFTTEGAYVEWKGEYLVSDQPLRLTTSVDLVREVK